MIVNDSIREKTRSVVSINPRSRHSCEERITTSTLGPPARLYCLCGGAILITKEKSLASIGMLLSNRLLGISGLSTTFTEFRIDYKPDCAYCEHQQGAG